MPLCTSVRPSLVLLDLEVYFRELWLYVMPLPQTAWKIRLMLPVNVPCVFFLPADPSTKYMRTKPPVSKHCPHCMKFCRHGEFSIPLRVLRLVIIEALVALHPLDSGFKLSHFPSRNSLLVHLIQFGRIACRWLRHIEPDKGDGDDTCASEQPSSLVAPVDAFHIDCANTSSA